MLLTPHDRLTPRAYFLLALFAALVFFAGQAQLPAFDRDEARFAQATKQMIQSDDYVDIKYQNEHRYKKPIGIYWLQAAAIKITGAMPTDLWAYRLPSYLSAIGTVVLTAAIGSLLFGGQVGLIAALLMASALIMNVEARIAKTDATLLFTIMAAQFALLTIWQRRTKILGYSTLFWAALAAGMLVKGPLILIPVLATLIGLSWRERSATLLKNLQPAIGVPLMLLLIAPWLIAITMKTGGAFWHESVGNDMLGKLQGGKESHGMPPGFYLVTFFATFWPAAPAIAYAAPQIWKERLNDKYFALLVWALPTWLLFEIFPTKLLHYSMPVFPALAILAAAAWTQGIQAPRWYKYICIAIFVLVTLGITIGFAALPFAITGQIFWLQIIVGVIALGSFAFIHKANLVQRAALACLLSALVLSTFLGITLPQWRYLWIAKQVEDALDTQTQCPLPLLASAQFNEPSLVFHVGTQTILNVDGAFAATYIAADPCQFALVDKKNSAAFMAQLNALHIAPEVVAPIQGFSLGGGDKIDMMLYRRTQP